MTQIDVSGKSLEYLMLLAKRVDEGKLPLNKFKRYQKLLSQWYMVNSLREEED